MKNLLKGFNAVLKPGAKVVLIDNLFIESSSSSISETDAEDNPYQARPLSDGTTHKVLKNFPSEAELRALLEGVGTQVKYKAWQHFWALEYVTIAP